MTDVFPLSPGQERLWFLEQMFPGTSAYNLPEAWRLKGRFDKAAFQQALNDVVARHETLRTSFLEESGKPLQRVHAKSEVSLRELDLSAETDPEAALRRAMEAEIRMPFNLGLPPLARVTLFRVSAEEHVLLLNLHHIISDEWSLGILLRDLSKFYEQHLPGKAADLNPLPIQYADFAVWKRETGRGAAFEKDLAYWKEHLSGSVPILELPTRDRRTTPGSFEGATVFDHIGQTLAERLKGIGQQHKASLYVVLLAAFKALLARYTRQEDLVVGTLLAGREIPETEDLIGFFVNTQVLRTDASGDPAFVELLGRVRESALGAIAHQSVSIDALVQELRPSRGTGAQPLFQVLFGLQPGATESWQLAALETSRVEVDNGCSKFNLAVLATESRSGIRLRCEFSTDLFEPATIERLLRHYIVLLEGVAADPSCPLSKLPLLTREDRALVMEQWNGTAAPNAGEKQLHELFEAQVERTPEATALVCGEERITYQSLNARAGHIASHLRNFGIGPEGKVGICMRRSTRLISGMLGILKSGGAYVALDPAYPRERLDFMLRDCGARVVLCDRQTARILPSSQATVLCVEDLEALPVPVAGSEHVGATDELSSAHLAYIIYTSGSTGRPKGVGLEHRNAVALVCWAGQTFSQEELAGVLASTSVCFDLSVFEIFVPLSWGGKVIVAENALAQPYVAPEEITLINTVPSAIRELLRLRAIPKSVKVVNLAGEPLPSSLVDEIYSSTQVRKVYDLYGPTETATYSTYVLRGPGMPATIGRPLSNERVYVLDGQMQPVPVGVAGEIFIAGAGVARGYLNLPELTASKFLDDPFRPGDRMYRTGDLGRWRPDGNLEFLGRQDTQVKIRGFRIELGEIETLLRNMPEVRDAAVLAREDVPGDKRIVAYVAPKSASTGLSSNQLRTVLASRLPDFMLPSAFVFLETLPLTPNGKINRQALPAPGDLDLDPSAPVEEPRNEVERALHGIWRELLGRSGFGIQDNFFLLGGHSLLATQVISRITSHMGVELPLRSIFESPTIAALADAVAIARERGKAGAGRIERQLRPAEASELLAKLDTLSDAEIEQLLNNPALNSFAQ